MSYGVEVRNASNAVRLSNGDMLHRLVQTGSVSVGPAGATVAVSGMTDSDVWIVTLTGDCSYQLQSGSFFCRNWDGTISTIYYAVYRR